MGSRTRFVPWRWRRARFLARAPAALAAICLVAFAVAGSAPAQQIDCQTPLDDVGEPCPDLQFASDITASVDGLAMLFSVPVVNLGIAASTETEVAAEAERLSPGSIPLPALQPKEQVTVLVTSQIPEDAAGETVRVAFTLDPSDVVQEQNDDNNTVFLSVVLPMVPTTTETTTDTTETTTETTTDTTEPTTTEVTDTGGSSDGSETLIWLAAIGGGVALAAGAVVAVRRYQSRRPSVFDKAMKRQRAAKRAPGRPEFDWGRQTPAAEPPEAPKAEPGNGKPEAQAEPPGAPLPEPEAQAEPEALERLGTPAVPPEEPPSPPARFVNTGFSRLEDPGTPLDSSTPLQPNTVYHFWLEVGEIVAGTIETTPVELWEAEELPPESRLKVVLFHVAGGPDPSRAAAEGELTIAPDGSVVVSAQPPFGANLDAGSELLRRRLFFSAETPKTEGTLQLRCSIYHKQVLLQSRLVTARVSELAEAIDGALTSELDFTLAPRLDPRHLASIPEYRLSLLLNQAGDGTHSLTVNGERFSDSATFDAVELQKLVERGRRSLRRVAWGSDEPWKEGEAYRYLKSTRAKLQADLIVLAIWGIRFYAAVCAQLAGERTLEELEASALTPGYIQLAVKQSPRHLLPLALLYDYIGLRDTARIEDYDLCPSFLAALDAEPPLEQASCFQGQCPSRGSGTTVCPSGFWGYRHALGIPVTLAGAPDVPTAITYAGEPAFSVAVCTDPAFTLRTAHEKVLRGIRPDLRYAATRADALTLLKDGRSHVVYFYCHGGLEQEVPFIKVGPLTEEAITSVTLLNERIGWEEPRPLLFLNGCHTTGLEPEQALEFVSALVRRAAAGVVGTEITVFEPLAQAFAEDCLRRFLGGTPLGWAIRESRLALLKAGNPLGLVYLPYALPSLRLVAR